VWQLATVEDMTPGRRMLIRSISAKLPALEAAIKEFKAVRTVAVETGGPIDMGDGTELRFVEQSRKEIDAQSGWPVLDDALDDDELASVVKIVKGKLESLIKARADKGHKQERWTAFLGMLGGAGAITAKPTRSLRRVKREV
jgi:hypothetical protein